MRAYLMCAPVTSSTSNKAVRLTASVLYFVTIVLLLRARGVSRIRTRACRASFADSRAVCFAAGEGVHR